MKRMLSILVAILMLVLLAGTSLAETGTGAADATSSATQVPGTNGGQPAAGQTGNGQVAGTPGLMGQITAIGDGSITISVNSDMQPPQGGNGQQGGGQPGNPQGGNSQQGNPPQGSGTQNGGSQQGTQPSGNPPQNGNTQNSNGQVSAEQKSVTITVTSATTFTLRGSNQAITMADLTVGMMVSVTVTGDDTTGYTATAIEADQAMTAGGNGTTGAVAPTTGV